jgi:hypothetical protein
VPLLVSLGILCVSAFPTILKRRVRRKERSQLVVDRNMS